MSVELDHLQQACQSGGKQCSSSQEINSFLDTGGNGQQNWQVESNKPDAEQIEAYRASFGFSADEVTTSNCELSEVLGDSLVISPFGAQKSYSGEFAPFDKRSMKSEMQTARLALFDSANVVPSTDCRAHANPNYYRQSEEIEAGYASETKNCDQTDELESFSRFGEFKFDKKDGTNALSSMIEKWTKYREKRIAKNGMKDQENFHIL